MPDLCSIEPRLSGQWRINISLIGVKKSVWHSPYEKYYIENLKRAKKTIPTRRLDAEQKIPKLVRMSRMKEVRGQRKAKNKDDRTITKL